MEAEISSNVAICAMAKSGQFDNFDGYDTIIGINNTHAELDIKVDMIVAMDDLERDEKNYPDYVKNIVNAGVPVYSTRRRKKWPSVVPYPLSKVEKFLNSPFLSCKLFDNSIAYAIALAMASDARKIGLSGVDLTMPYNPLNLYLALNAWRHKGHDHAPGWFKYYHDGVLRLRYARECGWESIHFLIGMAHGLGIQLDWMEDSTLLNTDRDDFYYGYQKQPVRSV